MASSNNLLRSVRKLHLYFGLFIAPALLFFAFTGALQTLRLHESSPGSSYHPPHWIQALAQLHKNQTLTLAAHKPRPVESAEHHSPLTAAESHPAAADEHTTQKPTGTLGHPVHWPMRIFFLLVCAGLFSSTLSGIYMGYKYQRNFGLVTGFLVAGVVIPLLLLL